MIQDPSQAIYISEHSVQVKRLQLGPLCVCVLINEAENKCTYYSGHQR